MKIKLQEEGENEAEEQDMIDYKKDTALIFWTRVIYVFTLWAVYLYSAWTRNIWLPNWKAWLSTAVHSWAPPKVIVFQLL